MSHRKPLPIPPRRGVSVLITCGLITCGLISLLAGCQAEYDPPSLIKAVRVIGVRAEPPWIGAEPTVITPKAVGAPAGAQLCWSWELCPFTWTDDGNFRCFDPLLRVDLGHEAVANVSNLHVFQSLIHIDEVFAKNGLDLSDLGQGEPGETDPNACKQAPEVEVSILFKVVDTSQTGGSCPTDGAGDVEAFCADRDHCVRGFKKLHWINQPDDQAYLVHANPNLDGVTMGGVEWPQALTPTVADGSKWPIEPAWPAESIETVEPKPCTVTKAKPESLLFSWFSTAGDFDAQRSFDEFPDNTFLPQVRGSASSQEVSVWVVARDGRNGTAWLERQLTVTKGTVAAGNPLCAMDPSLAGCP